MFGRWRCVIGRRRHRALAPLAAAFAVTVAAWGGTPELAPGTGVAPRAEPVRDLEFIQVGYGAIDRARRTLKAYGAALRGAKAGAEVTVLQEIARPDRFALLASADRAGALEAEGNGAESILQNLGQVLVAPIDRREHEIVEPSCAVSGASGLYVIAHLDIAGRERREADTALREFARSVCAAPGILAFRIWRQANRGNHFELIAIWASREQWARFSSAAAARRFRESVGPLLGSPYDERLYRLLE